MNARQFGLVGLLAALGFFAHANTATAQGTVTWDNGYPIIHDFKPPPGAQPRTVDVLGSYTLDQGWAVSNASFSWLPTGGGTLNTAGLDLLNGKVGALQGGQIVFKNIPIPSPGTYEVKISILYTKAATGEFAIQQTGTLLMSIK